jgi:putative transposase
VPRLVWLLRREGRNGNYKRVERAYREEGLAVRRRSRKRTAQARVERPAPDAPNVRWSMGFVRDTTASGRVFRALTIVDDFTRECVSIKVDTSLPAARVVSVLDQLVAIHGAPHAIWCDNGPELVSEPLRLWAERRGVALHFIQPGKPNQNAYIERFNRTYRREV